MGRHGSKLLSVPPRLWLQPQRKKRAVQSVTIRIRSCKSPHTVV